MIKFRIYKSYYLTQQNKGLPVTWILQDHLEVPSRTTCSAASRLVRWVLGSTLNTVL